MRQYIGARYVPKFLGTYDNTQQYEALCVVDNGLGTSYISKVPTPAGTPLTDTTYWAVYGATSGAIINLQKQIDDMNDGSVAGSLQSQINDADLSIAALESLVPYEKFRGKTICVIGDSISDYDVLANNWVKKLSDFLAPYGTTVINESDAGRSFASLKNDLDGGVVTIPTADIYILFIGTNYSDSWGFTSGSFPMIPGIVAVNNAIKAANPNAKYFFISPMKKYLSGTDTLLNPLCIVRSLLEHTFASYGYNLISGYNMGEMSAASYLNYTIDGIHPNEDYQQIMFETILDGLVSERGTVSPTATAKRSITVSLGSTSSASMKYNEDLTFELRIVAFDYVPTANTWVDICDLPTIFDSITYPLVYSSPRSNVEYRIQNGKLQAHFFVLPTSGQYFEYLKFAYDLSVND